MQAAQDKARATLVEHGVKIVDPPESEVAELRNRMVAHQDEVAKELKINAEMVKLVTTDASAGA